jgi:hypothetical protein
VLQNEERILVNTLHCTPCLGSATFGPDCAVGISVGYPGTITEGA